MKIKIILIPPRRADGVTVTARWTKRRSPKLLEDARIPGRYQLPRRFSG